MVRAIIADPLVTERLIIKEVEPPIPQSNEAIVQVKAISLNRGEIRDSLSGDIEQRLGWDYSGLVIEQAADGSGPAKGSRVVGLLPFGAWAEQIAARTSLMSEIPDSVSFAQASTIPVAGLSALYALKKRGLLLGKKVLITGSTGGVGVYAHQLAARTGAFVVGTARSEEKANLVREDGANQIVVGELSERAGQFGPYDLIIDTVGGDTLASLLSHLAPEGVGVTMGYSSSPFTSIDVRNLIHTGRTTLYGLYLLEELKGYSVPDDLRYLTEQIAEGTLIPRIEVEAPWTDIKRVADQLMERKYSGKAVLHLEN
ncbi:zinc-binding dehydrogenase [Paenibacillus sp. OAE614]|uniref:zinc-binding dehydrogenase n=1 Tax=Paenibacillus sp. OAE614 TaxID=2663804 RepID=UPI00178B4647